MSGCGGLVSRHRDVALAAGLSVAMTSEVPSRPDGRQLPALGSGLLATVPPAARRRLPLDAALLACSGLHLNVPGVMEASIRPLLCFISFFGVAGAPCGDTTSG
jgi:hypothetical protein